MRTYSSKSFLAIWRVKRPIWAPVLKINSPVWWCMPLIQVPRSQKQMDLFEFETGLVYIAKFQDTQGYTLRPCLKTNRVMEFSQQIKVFGAKPDHLSLNPHGKTELILISCCLAMATTSADFLPNFPKQLSILAISQLSLKLHAPVLFAGVLFIFYLFIKIGFLCRSGWSHTQRFACLCLPSVGI